jgi:hypothetical protein
MGFNEQLVRGTLKKAKGNINYAITLLINGEGVLEETNSPLSGTIYSFLFLSLFYTTK